MPVGDVVPELALALGAVAVLVFALFAPRRRQPVAALLALGAIGTAALASLAMLRGPQALSFFDTYAADGAAVWAKLILLGVAALVVLLSVEWFRTDPRHGEYYFLLLVSTLGAVVLAAAADLMELILGVVLSSAPGYVLASYHRDSPRSGEAGIKYFLLGGLTNGALLYGAALLFGLAGTTTYPGLAEGLASSRGVALVAAVALVAVALAFKLGAVPAHAWLPDVADGAPAPVAAFLTTAPKVGALVALARFALLLPEDGVGWRAAVAVLAAATMTLGNLAALWQEDVRRLLGWSAISQTGYALMAVVALGRSELAVPSLLLFLAAYALANLAAFGVVVELVGAADRSSYRGLASAHPLLAGALVIAFLSFVGIPPLVGFPAKLAVFAVAIEAGYAWLAVVAAANTVVSLAYYLRVVGPAYLERAPEPLPLLGQPAAVATGLAALGVVAAGILADPLLRVFGLARLLRG
ncbi:MAG: NADH-quinone oxidoreductase subunit N [Actinomycetota bacterium]|nr:NADH-quinone oxidoreductase subunit N [Actinomycetota bacterium]